MEGGMKDLVNVIGVPLKSQTSAATLKKSWNRP